MVRETENEGLENQFPGDCPPQDIEPHSHRLVVAHHFKTVRGCLLLSIYQKTRRSLTSTNIKLTSIMPAERQTISDRHLPGRKRYYDQPASDNVLWTDLGQSFIVAPGLMTMRKRCPKVIGRNLWEELSMPWSRRQREKQQQAKRRS